MASLPAARRRGRRAALRAFIAQGACEKRAVERTDTGGIAATAVALHGIAEPRAGIGIW